MEKDQIICVHCWPGPQTADLGDQGKDNSADLDKIRRAVIHGTGAEALAAVDALVQEHARLQADGEAWQRDYQELGLKLMAAEAEQVRLRENKEEQSKLIRAWRTRAHDAESKLSALVSTVQQVEQEIRAAAANQIDVYSSARMHGWADTLATARKAP
jgi:chromosome segregation ATPase